MSTRVPPLRLLPLRVASVSVTSRWSLLILVALPVLAGSTEARGQTITFADQAISRGIQYPVQAFPQTSGVYGFGVAAVDLDDDGADDVVALGRSNGQVGVYRNLGAGTFENRSATSGIAALPQASAIACADLDGDRLPEILLTQVNQPSRIYRNLGNFTFAPMALETGLGPPTWTKGVSLADIDLDGDLDFFLASYALSDAPPPERRSRLLRNDGAVLVNLAPGLGLDLPARTFLGVFSDIDRDGDADLYVSNDRGHLGPLFAGNELWRNEGGMFTDVSAASGADVSCYSMGVAAGDFDGNGFPDFLVTNIPAGEAPVFGVNPLMLGVGDGTFTRAESLWEVEDRVMGWGALFTDIDNNGWLDLYVNHQFAFNKLWRNAGAPPAILVPSAGGAAGLSNQVSYSTVTSDFDRDGDMDLLVSSLGSNVRLFMNQSTGLAASTRFRLVGSGLNRSAIGARIDGRVGTRWIMREIHAGGVGYLGQNSLEVHFGLAGAPRLDEAIVRFPGGAVRTIGPAGPGSHTVVHPAVLGDANHNGALDDADAAELEACMADGGGAGRRLCMWFDFNGDLTVTAADRTLFEAERLRRRSDLDEDGTVGARDLAILLSAWGAAGPKSAADLNEDGSVDADDLAIMITSWD